MDKRKESILEKKHIVTKEKNILLEGRKRLMRLDKKQY